MVCSWPLLICCILSRITRSLWPGLIYSGWYFERKHFVLQVNSSFLFILLRCTIACLPTYQWKDTAILEIQNNHCCALIEYVFHRLRYLNSWSPDGWHCFWQVQVASLEEVFTCSGLSKVQASSYHQPQFAFFDSCLQLDMWAIRSQLPAPAAMSATCCDTVPPLQTLTIWH